MVGWRLVPLLVAGLGTLIQTVNAQQNFRTVIVGGGGSGQGFIQGTAGSGPQRSIGIDIGGPCGPIDIGASLLKICDTNQDGAATPDEVKVGLLTWSQQADTDTNGALSEIELATALKQIFPVPQPPPGLPQMPEEFALHNLLAKKLMASTDVNKDGWLPFKEVIAFVDQSFSQWDSDASGSMNASELAAAFAQFMPQPGEPGGPGGGSRQLR